MKTKSVRWDLIWLDVKSWMVSCILMFSPLVLGAFATYIQGKELGEWGVALLTVTGALLKLVQKWIQSNTYVNIE
jgi:hypothetical protein